MKACLLVPVYNHGDTLPSVLEAVADFGVPCVVVDDGSDGPTRRALDAVPLRFPWATIERLPRNGGRGAALRHGYRAAARAGFSHAVQIDADGQHCAADVPRFLVAARRDPSALVLGQPAFDASAPRARRYGREISRFWVAVETLSRAVGDPLCGFRAVPLEPALVLLAKSPLGDRMEFDPELTVRWVWRGWPIVHVATRVVYPPGGRSNFRLVDDNVRISRMHARLVAGMLARAPRLLRARAGRRG
jgi:glycosyltransferase involved in cell wall biosynthesis